MRNGQRVITNYEIAVATQPPGFRSPIDNPEPTGTHDFGSARGSEHTLHIIRSQYAPTGASMLSTPRAPATERTERIEPSDHAGV